jgi:hypothetical protein
MGSSGLAYRATSSSVGPTPGACVVCVCVCLITARPPPMWKFVITSIPYANPVRTYGRVGGRVFGLTFGANVLTGLTTSHPPMIDLWDHPQRFMAVNLCKSVFFGCLWPCVPWMLLTAPGRREVAVLGASWEKRLTDDDLDDVRREWHWEWRGPPPTP